MAKRDRTKKPENESVETQTITYKGVEIELPQEVIKVAGCGKDVLTYIDVSHALTALADYNIIQGALGLPAFELQQFVPQEEPEAADEGSNVAAE